MTDPMTDRELAGCALLPCPFCGGADLMIREEYARVECECGAMVCDYTAEKAARCWNIRRTPSSEGDGRDAARYRWLRDLPDGSPYECIGNMPGDRWDDEIDAGMKERGNG